MMTPLVKKTIGFAPNGAVNLAKRLKTILADPRIF